MDEHVIKTYVRAEPRFVGGQGAELFDADGNAYLDFLGGIAVSALGHAHPRLVEALRDQVGRVLHTSNLFRHEYTEPVAERITRLAEMSAVFFCNSGAEAAEGALKIARKTQRIRGHESRTGFVALEGGFHGRTLGALSVTAHEPYRVPFEPLIPGVRWVEPDDASALEAALREDPGPAALILEPIQGEAGVRELDLDYLRRARALCTETGTVLIHDEVQCGSGRTGKFLCGAHAGVVPDIATLAKPLAGGVPIGAVVVRDELREVLVPGDHGSTFGGGPLACRAALVFLEELENGLLDAVAARGTELRAGLEAIRSRHPIVTEVRGRGLILGLQLAEKAPELQRELFACRLITNCTGSGVVRLLPPYVVSSAQVAQALDVIEACIARL